MSDKLLIIGAGGHGKVVADAALAAGRWAAIAFLDDRSDRESRVLGLPVLGTLAQLQAARNTYSEACVAIGDARTRLSVIERCQQLEFALPAIVHPSAVISAFASVGEASVVLANAVVNAGATLGLGCIVNTGATVDHDCRLGAGVHVCPGAHIAGNVVIGEATWIGIGASIRHGISIGREVTIGAGAAVVANAGDGLTLVGVPARVIKQPPQQ